MNAKSLLPLIAATIFSLSAHAHDCSGGASGGMDATGNQCNDATVATVVASDGATFPSNSVPKVETSKPAASCSKSAAKHTTPTHHAAVHSRIKHG